MTGIRHDPVTDGPVSRARLNRRRLLHWSAAGAALAAISPQIAAAAPLSVGPGAQRGSGRPPAGRMLFQTRFTGSALDTRFWNPYITDDPSNGWPWNMQTNVAEPSSATGGANGFQADYDLPSSLIVDNGLRLRAEAGTQAAGYTWTGAVMCSRPTDNNFGSGTIHTQGVTFTSGYVEVGAKMPAALDQGMWPGIWFLAAPPASGDNEIDLFEGGFTSGSTDPSRIMSCNMPGSGNAQQLIDTGVDLSADYHLYGLEYRPGELVNMYFDNQLVCSYTENIPSVPYFIIVDLAVASALTDPWHSQVTPQTQGPFDMLVSHIDVRALR